MSTTSPRPSAHPARDSEPTLGALVHDLSEQLPELIRTEIRLAQAEVSEKGKKLGIGLGMFGATGYLAYLGSLALVAAAVLGLAEAVPGWAAALIVAAVLFAIGGVAAVLGRRQVAAGTPPVPERAVEGIRDDLTTLKEIRP